MGHTGFRVCKIMAWDGAVLGFVMEATGRVYGLEGLGFRV